MLWTKKAQLRSNSSTLPLPLPLTRTLSHTLSLNLSRSLSLSLTHSLTFNKGSVKEISHKTCYARGRSTGTCFQVQLAPSLEQVRIDRLRLWLAQRGKHHSRIPSLKHDTEPAAPSRKTGRCDVGCLEGEPASKPPFSRSSSLIALWPPHD